MPKPVAIGWPPGCAAEFSVSLTVHFRTFGCKLNQLESESLAAAFAAAGADVWPRSGPSDMTLCDPDDDSGGSVASISGDQGSPAGFSRAVAASAEVHVFNTCTVTSKAEQKARREIRLAARRNPAALLLVSGCYAQLEATAIAALAPRVVGVPGDDKARLHGLAECLAAAAADRLDLYEAAVHWLAAPASSGDRFAFAPTAFRFHSRPSLKIQDGCDNRCAYCRVCLARGPSVSLEPTRLLERVRALEAAGAPEIVLTGVNLSQYRAVGLDFSALLGWLLAETDRVAFRISSWEPDRVDDAFLAVFSASRVRPHLHLAAQSGSDVTLRAMGRHYGAARLLAAVADLRRVKVDPFLGADLICGFPGETDAQFGQTLALAEQADFAWIHAFTYSPRPGTAAAKLLDQVPPYQAVVRTARLTALADSGRRRFAARRLGAKLEAVLERAGAGAASGWPAFRGHLVPAAPSRQPPIGPAATGWRVAVSADYLKIAVRQVPPGQQGALRVLVDTIVPEVLPPGIDLSAGILGAASR